MMREKNSSPTRTLAEFACNLNFEALPDSVIQKLKLHILDSLGAALYASNALV
jgi:2-methylcitrate dehydratase PrpD